ncbi:MAG: site-specific tyrosine recombinase/integron integrase [Actinomycetota bacterium]|nr:site-specific tyrosine recombinase/integron integrase [Actinomycetota bacterium]
MDLFNCLGLYVKYLKYEKNLSLNSIKSYRKDISQFLLFLKKRNITGTGSLDIEVFREFLIFIDDYNYSNKTLVRKYSSLVNFFKFLEMNDFIDFQLTQLINVPRVRQGLYSFLSVSEMRKLFNSMRPLSDLEIRDRAIIEFLYSTGARVSEAENLKLNDFDIENNELVVTGKGRKQRFVYLNKAVLYWIRRYMEARNRIIYSNKDKSKDDRHFFLNRFGRKLTSRSIRNIVKKYVKKAKINKNITPHSIRHSFATHLLQEGAGIREIQELLGHENISTTQIYSHLNVKKLKKDYKKFHPRAENDADGE